MSTIESLSAVTFVTTNMARSVRFYHALGFEKIYGGESADFTSFRAGDGYLNIALRDGSLAKTHPAPDWGRAIFYVDDVDAMHARVVESGFTPEFEPRDAAWGERYFHVRDPDGHEVSFARPLT
jgi:catechol 2,3-dioxygenase-like lactoylglutathione lyase family enzyme